LIEVFTLDSRGVGVERLPGSCIFS